MEDFDFSSWKKQFPSAVVDELEDNGFDSYPALVNATEEDIASLNLKRGHHVAVRSAITSLRAAAATASSTQPSFRPPPSASQPPTHLLLDDLLKTSAATVNTARVDLEPTAFLATRKPGERVLRVTDFISTCSLAEEEEEVELGGGLKLRLPRNSKPKLDTVTPAQFLAANARIMASLLESGRLAETEILDYLSYTAKIGEMATRYTWGSVLLYDDQYRHSQAAYGFRWGSDSQHLALVALRERTPTTFNNTKQPNQRPSGFRGRGSEQQVKAPSSRPVAPSGKQICQQWNRGHCTFTPNCQYEHVCATCFQPTHPASRHPQNATVAHPGGPLSHP